MPLDGLGAQVQFRAEARVGESLRHQRENVALACAEPVERVVAAAPGDQSAHELGVQDDVTAGHAASAGKVDPLQIYYLMSRGMTKADAERLIIYGFLNPLLEEIPIEDVVKQLKRVIERKLR